MATNSKEVQRKADEKRRGERTRNWSVIVYPESAPENWRDILDQEHIKWVESPLHDSDINSTGEQKKPHWHIVLMFDSNKTYEQVKSITDKLNTVVPQKCNSVEGSVRYMIHIDNPEKFQYNRDDIVVHGNVDISKYFEMSLSQKYALIDEMSQFIINYDVVEFMDLKAYAMQERPDWNEVLHGASYEIINLIKSRRHGGRKPVNPVTGESF
jgi:hypothetical protein